MTVIRGKPLGQETLDTFRAEDGSGRSRVFILAASDVGLPFHKRLTRWTAQSLKSLVGGKSQIKNKIARWRARLGRSRSRALFICITGSSAKSSTAGILSHILAGLAPVHSQVGTNAFKTCVNTLSTISPAHRYVVCEIGTEGPGSLQPMIDLVKPSVGVVTLVGLEHYSAFRSLDAVAEEKRKLIEALPKNGLAVLNHEDPWVLAMASRAHHVLQRLETWVANTG